MVEARAEDKSVGVAILVTTRVDERLELIQARRKLNVPRLCGGNKGKRRGSDERPLPGHNECRECNKLLAKLKKKRRERKANECRIGCKEDYIVYPTWRTHDSMTAITDKKQNKRKLDKIQRLWP